MAARAPSVHVVNHGDTLLSIARRNHVPVAELARANNLEPIGKLKLGMKLTVPGAASAAAAPAMRAGNRGRGAARGCRRAARHQDGRRRAGPQQSARLAQADRNADGNVD